MSKICKQPHDHFFRKTMKNPRFCEEFFEQYLPNEVKEIIGTIKREDTHFFYPELRERISDTLFSAEFKDGSGCIYFLVEHQSTPDNMLPFRLFQYSEAIMEEHLDKKGKKIVPAIYPIVIYTGKEPYEYPVKLPGLFGNNEKFVNKIIQIPYRFVNFSKKSDKWLGKPLLVGMAALVMKHIRDEDFFSYYQKMSKRIIRIVKGEEKRYIYSVVDYIYSAGNGLDKEKFLELTSSFTPAIDMGEIMTIAEQYKKEGMQKGMQKGIQKGMKKGLQEGMQEGMKKGLQEGMQEGVKKGLQEGMQEGVKKGLQEGVMLEKTKIAAKLLEKGISIQDIAELTALSCEKIEQLSSSFLP